MINTKLQIKIQISNSKLRTSDSLYFIMTPLFRKYHFFMIIQDQTLTIEFIRWKTEVTNYRLQSENVLNKFRY